MNVQSTVRHVLYATSATSFASYALRRAYELARLTRAELHVLVRMTPRPPLLGVLAAELLQDASELAAFVDAARQASAWCHEVIGGRFDDERIGLRVGDFANTVIAYAEAVAADWIVVPGGEQPGAAIIRLAREAQRPVFVVRPKRGGRAVIAASDLRTARLPVLEQALQVAEPLGASVTLLHNMRPTGLWRPHSETRARASRLRAARANGDVCATVLTRSRDAVEAILSQAREHHADIVVVGTHERSWFSRAVHRSVAADVVNRAQRSVMIAPIP